MSVQRVGRRFVGVLTFDADELRNIAYALGLSDGGAQEMLALADDVDVANGVLCACGKPAEHLDADEDGAEWACLVPLFDPLTGTRLPTPSDREEQR